MCLINRICICLWVWRIPQKGQDESCSWGQECDMGIRNLKSCAWIVATLLKLNKDSFASIPLFKKSLRWFLIFRCESLRNHSHIVCSKGELQFLLAPTSCTKAYWYQWIIYRLVPLWQRGLAYQTRLLVYTAEIGLYRILMIGTAGFLLGLTP